MSKDLLKQLEKVDLMIENANYDEAIWELEPLARIYKSEYTIFFYLGNAHLCKKNMKEA